jgi:hypothetical protein
MSDDKIPDSVLEELSTEEQRVLLRALKRIEREVYEKVVKRLVYALAIALGILTLGGVISWSSFSTSIENGAIQKFTSDLELRDRIASKSLEKVTLANDKSEESQKGAAKAVDSLNEDLKQLRMMFGRVNEEIQKLNNKPNKKLDSRHAQPGK